MTAPSLTMYDTLLAFLALLVTYLVYQTLTSPNAPYPGPRPYPLIGNLPRCPYHVSGESICQVSENIWYVVPPE